jgi:translation initiation factor RLI1
LFVYKEKSQFVREKWKMTLSLRVQFNGSVINLLVFAMKPLSAQAIDNELVAVLGPDAIGCSTVTNYLRQRHFPSTLRETPDEPLHGVHWDFP